MPATLATCTHACCSRGLCSAEPLTPERAESLAEEPPRETDLCVVASAREVALGCPNLREELTTLAQIHRWLAAEEPQLTPEARRSISYGPAGARIDTLAEAVLRGDLCLLEISVPVRISGGSTVRVPAPPPPPPPPPPGTKTFINFRVVDDVTGDPIGGVTMDIELTDGSRRNFVTRPDGMVEIDEINAGVCQVHGLTDPRSAEVVRVESA